MNSGTLLCPIATVAPSTPVLLTLAFTVSSEAPCGTLYQNSATVSGNYELNLTNNVSETVSTIVTCVPKVDLAVSKSGPETVERGSAVIYSLSATNYGPDGAASVMLQDQLPSGVTFDPEGSSDECIQDVATVNCTGFSLAPDQARVFTLSFKPLNTMECGTRIQNVATITSSSTEEINPSNNTSLIVDTILSCPPPTPEPFTAARTFDFIGSGNGSHRGHNTNVTQGYLNRMNISARLPSPAFGGSPTPLPPPSFGGSTRNVFCDMQMFLSNLPDAPSLDWLSEHLSKKLRMTPQAVRVALLDGTMCK